MAYTYSGLIVCNTCNDPKEIHNFYKTKTNKSGRMNICSPCFQNKYAPKRETQITSVVLTRDSNSERNKKLKGMTNEQVMKLVRGAVADIRGKRESNKYKPIIEWDALMKTKLVTPTKIKYL